jgi:hypothetical protein
MTKTARQRLLRDYRRALRAGEDEPACLEGFSERCDGLEEYQDILAAITRIMADEMTRPASVYARQKD